MATREDETTTETQRRRRVRVEPMDQRFETGFTRGDADDLIAHCEELGIKPAAFIRQVTLAALKRERKNAQ